MRTLFDIKRNHKHWFTLFLLLLPIRENAISQTFKDVTWPSGFKPAITRMVNGAWCDFNRDGFQDIFIKGGDIGTDYLMRNNGNGTFVDVAAESGIKYGIPSVSGTWGDYNNDSWPDLLVLARIGLGANSVSQFYKNLGTGQFTDIAPGNGMNLVGDGETPRFFDYDGDGDLDAIMTFYKTSVPPTGNHLFRNDGKDGFTDVTTQSGISTLVNAEATIIFDYDGDGDLDLYLSATLYRNNSDGTFTDVTAQAGLPYAFDEGGSAGDFDNDGWIDLLLCEHDQPIQRYTKLYRNLGDGSFVDVTDLYGLPHAVNWDAGFIDYDNDGWLDIWFGSMYGGTDPFTLFKNQNGQAFSDSTESLGLPHQISFCLPAWADYDNDGDMDVAIGQLDYIYDSPIMFENRTNNNNYLFVKVTDQNGNENQFGATIRIYDAITDTLLYTKVVGLGQEYLSQNQYATHFGLVESGSYDIEVTFSSVQPYVIRLSKTTNSILGGIIPSSLGSGALNRTIEIRRDGKVVMNNFVHIPVNHYVPSLSRVANNAIVRAEDSLSLAWGLYDSDTHTYELEINRTSDFTNPQTHLVNLTDTVYRTQYPVVDTLFWRVRVQDEGASAPWSDIFTFKTQLNKIPFFVSVPDTIAQEDFFYSYQAAAEDEDISVFGDVLRYNLIVSPLCLTIDSVNGTISGVPKAWHVGDTVVTVRAYDKNGGEAFQTFSLHVIHTNHAPFWVQEPDTLAKEDLNYQSLIFASDPDSFLFGDQLRYRLSQAPRWLTVDTITGILKGTPLNNTEGDTVVSALAVDPSGSVIYKEWHIRIDPTNYPPSPVTKIYPINADTLTLFKVPIPRTFRWTSAVDPDIKDTVSYTFHLKGKGLDTVITNLRDTTVTLNGGLLSELACYEWTVLSNDHEFSSISFQDTSIFYTTKRVSNSTYTDLPETFRLFQNYPNPFNPNTLIRFQLPEKSKVRIEVYNILGQSVYVLFNGTLDAKYYEMDWTPRSLASGVYFTRITAESVVSGKKFRSVKKMTYLK